MSVPSISFVGSRRLKYLLLVPVFLLVLLIGITGGKSYFVWYTEDRWEEIASGEGENIASTIGERFKTYQNDTFGRVMRTVHDPELVTCLGSMLRGNADSLFNFLITTSSSGTVFEAYDSKGVLVAWGGPRGPSIDPDQLRPEVTSYVLQGPIYSYLIISAPIRRDTVISGYLVGKRYFDVNYPISNRFINRSAFASTFTATLHVSPTFEFGPEAQPSPDGRMMSIALQGIDGSTIGYAYLQKPTLSGRIEDIRTTFDRWIAVTLVMILFAAALLVVPYVLRLAVGWRIALFTVALWVLRYLLIWTGLPGTVVSIAIFDPAYFASRFGYGLAQSLGDLLLSAGFLLTNIIAVSVSVSRRGGSAVPEQQRSFHGGSVLRIAGIIVLVILTLLLIRGYGAAVHSAVFDSNLHYNDPTSVVPSLQLSMMLVALLFLTLALLIAGAVIVGITVRLMQHSTAFSRPDSAPWIILLAGFSLGGVLFGIFSPNPMLTLSERLLVIVLLWLFPYWLYRSGASALPSLPLRGMIVSAAVSVMILVPILNRNVQEYDRARLELVANDIIKPGDDWLKFILNRALDELANEEAAGVLFTGNADDVEKLAFTRWAKSILSEQGYNCAINYVDWEGNSLSDFRLGVSPLHDVRSRQEYPPTARIISVDEQVSGLQSVRWYTGYSPIMTDAGVQIGGVWVELSAGRQSLLRGDAPEILRNYSSFSEELQYRTIVLSEYIDGYCISSSSETMPLERLLPGIIRDLPPDRHDSWLEEEINGISYETYYLRGARNGSTESWIAIGMERSDLRGYMYILLRYIFFYVIVGITVLVIVRIIQIARGGRASMGLRAKLLGAFVIVSLIPVFILAYYNREYAIERAREVTIERLSSQSGLVVAELQKTLDMNAPVVLTQLTDRQCEEIATALDVDFSVFYGIDIQASSKPEMFTAELLDRSLSAPAYLNIIAGRQGYYTETHVIGNFPYVVGYRPLVSQAGTIIGVVAVPTLFRQEQIDAELAKRNVYLFGAYVVALLIAIVAGSIFANQISAPVRRLKAATRRIAAGELEIDLKTDRTDELGELEQAFNAMTIDLRRTQEEMMRAQREAAWREMAKQVAHEIKNPLTPMKLSIQHLRQAFRDRTDDVEKVLDKVSATILEQIETLSRIATEFSQFARMPERRIEPCNVHDVLREAANLFVQHPGILFSMKFDATSSVINADREEIRRTFINIIRNAIQAMGEKGSVTITSDIKGEELLISINDTGPGIPDNVRTRLFEPNFSTKTDGMGLGLSIVRKTVEDLGGKITVESAMNRGTTVTLHLPQRGTGEKSPGSHAGG